MQRKIEFKLAPGVKWTVVGYIDLETRGRGVDGQVIERVVDYKVKNSPTSQVTADDDPQAGLYLAGRWFEGNPAQEFCFAQIAKPGPRRKKMSSALVTTTRSVGRLRSSFARIAQAASQMVLYYERYGPDRSWGFADPTSWKCSARFCDHYWSCPGGGGL